MDNPYSLGDINLVINNQALPPLPEFYSNEANDESELFRQFGNTWVDSGQEWALYYRPRQDWFLSSLESRIDPALLELTPYSVLNTTTVQKHESRPPEITHERLTQSTAEEDQLRTSRGSKSRRARRTTTSVYSVDAILEKWKQGKRDWYLVRWESDKTCWWVLRRNIDKNMILEFEDSFKGHRLGIAQVLKTRGSARKKEHLIKWSGRPGSENTWVRENKIDPEWFKF